MVMFQRGILSEEILGRYSIPQNAEPVDIDSDGDLDIIVGSRGERRIAWFETKDVTLAFKEHAIGIVGALVSDSTWLTPTST